MAPSSFAVRPTIPAGNLPSGIATGDFNGDGHPDWAISNGRDSSIWLYMGRGDGTSNLPTIITLTGAGPTWITAVDLRGNGILDLVVSEADSGTVGVLLGNGDGTFQPESQYSVPAPPLFVLGGDFNEDGKLDIAVGMIGTTATGPVAVLPGDGLGHLGPALFTAVAKSSVAQWLASADLNGDGKPDLVVVDPDDALPHGGAQVYLSKGDGTFTEGQVFDANGFPAGVPPDVVLSVALADVNGDGCIDAVVTQSYGIVLVIAGNCDGTFGSNLSQYDLGDIGAAVQLADVNGNGHLDIVTSGVLLSGAGGPGLGAVAGNLVSILFGDGTGHFNSGVVYRGEPSMYGLAVVDLRGNGLLDIITANQGSSSATVFLNDGKGGVGDPQGEPFGYGTGTTNSPDSPFLFADVDGNGTKDIVLLQRPPFSPGTMEVTALLNDGTGKFGAPIQSAAWNTGEPMLPGDWVLADFRNTGRPDVLVVALDFTSPFLFFAPNLGGGKFGSGAVTAPTGAVGALAVGDFNGDGNLDFVTASDDAAAKNAQVLSVFLGNGDGTFRPGETVTYAVGNGSSHPGVVYAGDFNRDGKLDVLVLDGALYEFLGDGDGTFQPARVLFSSFASFTLTDLNRDGWWDIVALTDASGIPGDYVPTLSTFLGQADGTFKLFQTYTPYLDTLLAPRLDGTAIPLNPFEAVLGDFNGDGTPDIALFQSPPETPSEGFLQVLLGNGDGALTPTYATLALSKGYAPQFAADVNGDGLADLIESDNYTSSLNVLKSVAAAPTLQLQIVTNPMIGGTAYGRVTLNLPSNTPTTVSLSASDSNIVLPALTVPEGSISEDFQFTVGPGFDARNVFSIQGQIGTSTSIAYGYVLSNPAPVIELTPAALLFGGVDLRNTSNPQNITLKNLGGVPLSVTSVTTGSWYSETDDCVGTIPPGGTCTLRVTFTAPFPSLAAGAVTVFDNAQSGKQSVDLEGYGLGLMVDPCCVNFSPLSGTTSRAQTVTVTNAKSVAVGILVDASSASAAGFAGTSNCGTLQPAASCQVTVTFDPTAAGTTASGNIVVTDTSTNGDGYLIALSGTGNDFSLGSASPVTVKAGETATYALRATSMFAFAGTVALSCGGGPQGTACAVTPSSVSLDPDLAGSYTLTVKTTPRSVEAIAPSASRHQRYGPPLGAILAMLLVASVLGDRRARKWVAAATVLLGMLLMGSCGGGATSGGTGSTMSGTPVGSYAITVTGTSNGGSRTVNVSLTVQ